MTVIKNPCNISEEEVLTGLGVSPEEGLTGSEALARLRKYGQNRLVESKPASALSILVSQFRSLIVLLLIGAALLSFTFGDWAEGVAVIIVILLNSAIGFFTEIRAVRSMEALYKLVRIEAKVKRGGTISVVHAEELVPGDIVILEAGDMVPALVWAKASMACLLPCTAPKSFCRSGGVRPNMMTMTVDSTMTTMVSALTL